AVSTQDADARIRDAEASQLDMDGVVPVAAIDAHLPGRVRANAVVALSTQDADRRAEAHLERVVAGAAVDAAAQEGVEVANAVVAVAAQDADSRFEADRNRVVSTAAVDRCAVIVVDEDRVPAIPAQDRHGILEVGEDAVVAGAAEDACSVELVN